MHSKNTLGKAVDVVDMGYNTLEKVSSKGIRGILKVLLVDGCDVPERYIEGRIANRYLKSSESKSVIAFAECKTTKTKDTYLFIDCSVDYA